MHNPFHFHNPVQQFVTNSQQQTTRQKNEVALPASPPQQRSVVPLASSDILNQKIVKFKGDIPSSGLRFPSDLPGNRPVLEIKAIDARDSLGIGTFSIFFPAPDSITNTNGASYDNAELGVMGAMSAPVFNAIADGFGGENIAGAIAKSSADSLDSFKKNVAGNPLATLTLAASNIQGMDKGVANAARVASRAKLNPNIVSEFTGNKNRTYEFTYDLIPNSEAEAKTIETIVKLCQVSVYAELEGFLLRYPPRFQIKILNGITESSKANNSILNMFQCYLTDFNVTYNGENNSFFQDGSPLKTSITLSFTETKVLTANDILKLQAGQSL